ncbi:hypothetical protein H0I25_11915 [Cellulophaga sp. HaHa_2_95]|uniref:hypothetical protein n=1 Tax=Cellulophaga sp. HaHa_2_95 TaxID=2745558 RepID=UPI001C4ECC24|nr:hypothetical protein [Cellulophaga sp. HaHa_2_95]QXP54792.1 hypothetical protein H0I25_11915 [Cellulophaga sp. HaHa_2_95]
MTTNKLKILFFFILFAFVWLGSSCRKDFDYEDSTGNLSFSKDTIFLDTVFTNIGSSTYALKVYNTTDKDLQIPSITLENGIESFYRINVDGQAGTSFLNTPLLAKDSLYIFIETTVDISTTNQTAFLYLDAIRFDTGIHEQKIPLVTLVKDAIFLFPSDINQNALELGTTDNGEEIEVTGFELSDDQLNFNNEKAYVIYGYATVPKNKTLNIAAGARVYFHENSGIYLQESSNIIIQGQKSSDAIALENEVIFEGDRLEPAYANTSGQWGTIWFDENSVANELNYLTIKNATIGLAVHGNASTVTTNLTLKNTQIYNSSSVNLWTIGASISAENVVMANAGGSSVNIKGGSTISFIHSTIANYWTSGSRLGPALQITNDTDQKTTATFGNCIITGNSTTELSIASFNTNTDALEFQFTNSMITINAENFTGNPWYDFQNETLYKNIMLNEEAAFVDPIKNIFALTATSFALDKGDVVLATQVPLDINDIDRTTLPSLGAYQYTPE